MAPDTIGIVDFLAILPLWAFTGFDLRALRAFRLFRLVVTTAKLASRTLDGVVGAVRLSGGDIVIGEWTTGQLRRYDREGNLVWRAAGKGEGPGEHRLSRGRETMTRLDSVHPGEASRHGFMGPPARSSRALARRLRSSGWVAHRARLGSCFLLAIGTVALLACVDDHRYRQDGKRVVGYMDFPEYAAELGIEPQIPDKATATVPLEITFWTTGLGCDEGGDTEVVVHGRTAVVTPYDFLDVWPSCYSIGGRTDPVRRPP